MNLFELADCFVNCSPSVSAWVSPSLTPVWKCPQTWIEISLEHKTDTEDVTSGIEHRCEHHACISLSSTCHWITAVAFTHTRSHLAGGCSYPHPLPSSADMWREFERCVRVSVSIQVYALCIHTSPGSALVLTLQSVGLQRRNESHCQMLWK